MLRITTFVTLFLTLTLLAPTAMAQDATPASPVADPGLPELAVTVTGAGYEGIPESVEAGRYLVSLTAGDDVGEFGVGIALVQPPEGMMGDDGR